jgi:hypothetical protein
MLRTLGLVAAALIVLATASTATAGEQRPLGGLQLNAYCQAKGFDNVVFPRGQLGHNAAVNNWRCWMMTGETQPLSMTQACKWQYGLNYAHARFTDIDDAYTWGCYASANSE